MNQNQDRTPRTLFAMPRVRVVLYALTFLGFALFFSMILTNKDSRYNRRMEQMDTRRSTRMSMMRENYKRADSIFKEEQKRMAKEQSAEGKP